MHIAEAEHLNGLVREVQQTAEQVDELLAVYKDQLPADLKAKLDDLLTATSGLEPRYGESTE